MLLYTVRVFSQIVLGYVKDMKLFVNTSKQRYYLVKFRCGLSDLDTYFHMNNSKYLHIAELARWRVFPISKLLSTSLENRWMFLAVEQNVRYLKPIQLGKKFVVRTTLDSSDNKWLIYNHYFEQDPSDITEKGNEPIQYCHVSLRAVIKEKSGKTVRPSDMILKSDWNKEMMSKL